jgi:hypothetical protein
LSPSTSKAASPTTILIAGEPTFWRSYDIPPDRIELPLVVGLSTGRVVIRLAVYTAASLLCVWLIGGTWAHKGGLRTLSEALTSSLGLIFLTGTSYLVLACWQFRRLSRRPPTLLVVDEKGVQLDQGRHISWAMIANSFGSSDRLYHDYLILALQPDAAYDCSTKRPSGGPLAALRQLSTKSTVVCDLTDSIPSPNLVIRTVAALREGTWKADEGLKSIQPTSVAEP